MTQPIDVVAFDGDDTLWHNESIFTVTQAYVHELLSPYIDDEELGRRLLATETSNIRLFGYGIKGFTLSMIETAIEVSGGRITAGEIAAIIEAGKAMLSHPVELLDGVSECLRAATAGRRVMLITKGDLFDQESKLARSGLGESFWKVEIVSEKDTDTYRRVLARHEIDPGGFLMVGNSLRSDIAPVVAIGGRAAYIPYHTTWAHEVVDPETVVSDRYWTLDSLAELPDLLLRLDPSRQHA